MKIGSARSFVMFNFTGLSFLAHIAERRRRGVLREVQRWRCSPNSRERRPGALAGAFLLGLVEQLAVWKLNSAWQTGLVFAVLLAFLIARPQGLFGGRFVVRRA
jgi:hypothetical protein